ncbi:MAG: acyl-CoA thioesterase [Ruminococcus flavefaciens]|nr:acyl-CoA thioesterase [Ruminococcus flavefaciens]MCM1231062.1 acyl-CoA thioesterase [Ruminococcus flavefaciens]
MIKPYSRRVYYYETDKMAIMHHSNYIRIFEECRVDFLRQSGMPFEEIESRGILMPVLSAECHYKHPLRFDDPFAVYMTITRFNGVSLYVSYRIFNTDTDILCAEGNSSHCFTDENLRPLRIKNPHPDIYRIFDDYMKNPIIK